MFNRTCLLRLLLGASIGCATLSIDAQTVSKTFTNQSFKTVLKEIETQTGMSVIYKTDEVNESKKVTITLTNASVTDALSKVLDPNLTWEIRDKMIVISRKNQSSSAKKVTVKGKILDSQNMPVIGASVIEKGTSNGTITDFDGNFTFTASENSVLQVSYVGYKSQQFAAVGGKELSIVLKEDTEVLDEVVVIGYGTTTKRKLTGSVSSLNAEKLESTPFPNVTQALQGQVPGLIVNSSGGALGEMPSISIRGGETPLFVIDGVISDAFVFSTLNPEDIESMSFLKDASATAVYGSKAGNGIVLVQTKKGKTGTPKVRYSMNLQLSQPTVLPAPLDTYEFAEMANQVYLNEGSEPFWTPEQMALIGKDPDYPNNNWQDLVLKNLSPEQKHTLSVGGGSEHTNYYVSLGYMGQEGILKSDASNLDRTTLRSNVTTKFENIGLEINTALNGSIQNTREPYDGSWFQLLYNTRPYVPGYNPDGTLAAGNENPLVRFDKDSGYIKKRKKYLNGQISATWKPKWVDGLSFSGMVNYNDIDYFEKSWNATAKQYELDGSLYQSSVKPSMDVKSGYSRIFDMEFKAAYLKTFGKHTLDATFVYTQRKGFSEFVSAGRKNYISTSMDQLFAGSVDGLTNDGSAAESASMGYVGRLKYDYLSKYIIEFSGRYDGNDNFHPDKRWGFFPAVSAVWMISDENFMQKLNDKNILNSLKLRASYGETGISDGVTRFGYMALYNQGAMKEYYNAGNILNVTFSEGNLVNPLALTWYTRKSFNVGFDFASLNNRLEGSLDYFYYKTSGYLMSPNNIYATTLGKPLPEITSGSKHRRAGFELNLRYKEKRGNLYYEIGGNISYYNQLWEQLDSEDLATLKNPYTRQTHEKDYFYSMYLSDGLFQNKEQILNSPRPLPSTETSMGDIKYIDANGDGKIDSNDMRRVGQPSMPHLNYGFDFRVEYKGWSLSALFQGTGDRYIAMGQQMQRGDYASVITKFQADYWTPENTDARFPRVTKAGYPNGENNALVTDFFNMNAKYFRLKNLQISYNLKRDLLKNCNFIQGCRITLSGTNLFTVSDVLDFTDPEAKMIEPDKIEKNLRSISGASYPVFRTYSLGLNVEF